MTFTPDERSTLRKAAEPIKGVEPSRILGEPAPALTQPLTRPVLRWHGGKWGLGPWIIEHLPEHRIYVEPFGGAASVLMRKPRSYGEVYNDLDDDVVNLFRVLRDEALAPVLVRALELTPYAREEFELTYELAGEPLERARRLCVRSFMGFGSNGHNAATKTGFRANTNRSGTTPAHDWRNYPNALRGVIDRLRGVVIDNRHALEVMAQHDSADTLHYVDPPYILETRSQSMHRSGCYAHEMDMDDHAELLEALCGLAGKVVLSGYPHPLYDDALRAWDRIERDALADGARARTEVLWLNKAAQERTLFSALSCESAAVSSAVGDGAT